MSTTNNTKGAIVAQQKAIGKSQPTTLKSYIKLYEKEIAKALPAVLTPERFSRMAMTALTKTPKLAECTPQSFLGALLTAAQLGLEPNTPLGQAYLIPYGKECQFQVGYKGMIDLCYRSGEFKSISANIVYENDEFEFEYGLDEKLKHKPCMTERGEAVWVYAVYRLTNGGYGFTVMSCEECMEFGRKYSKTFGNGPWKTAPEEMMKKTVLKRVLKYAPIRSEFIRGAEESDGHLAVFNNNSDKDEPQIDYIDVSVDTKTGEVIEEQVQQNE